MPSTSWCSSAATRPGAPAALTGKPGTIYNEAHVHQRSRMIALAIDARAQRHPSEPRFAYEPMLGQERENRWSESARDRVLKDYNLLDMGI